MKDEYILCIDFGTSSSCMGVWINDKINIIPNGIIERATPSLVVFDSNGKIYIGEETINKVWNEDIIKIYEIKRLIGKKYDEVKNIIKYFGYKVIKGDDDQILISLEFKNKKIVNITPEYIVFLIFSKLINNAKFFLHKDINQVIITVPSNFNDHQRNSIKYAAEKVKGISVKKIINEPSVAAISSGFPKKYMENDTKIFNENKLKKNSKINAILHPLEEIYLIENRNICKENSMDKNQIISFKNIDESIKIIVFDLGAGTYDVSLIEYSMGIFDILASAGNSCLGGADFDNRLIDFCLNEFCNKNKDKNFLKDEIYRNKKSIQRLKIKCEQTKKYLSIKFEDTIYIEDFYKGETLCCKITREQFEKICKPDFDKLIPPIDRVLSDQKMKEEDINEIILVGGSSKIPKIKQILTEKFPNVIINDSINPEEAVLYGAIIISETERKKIGEFWEDFDYLDSIQHSYGIEVENGKMEFILRRGSKYPANNTKYYFTYSDYQTNFRIKIYEGENDYVKDNEYIDEFILNGIPKKKKGEICLSVTFSIDENQILSVKGYIAERNIKKEIIVERNRKKYLQNSNFSSLNSSEVNNKKLKTIKEEIIRYSQKFQNASESSEKLILIKKYDEAIIYIIKLLEEKDPDSYFNFIEKLFQSYSYIINSELFILMEKNDKDLIEENLLIYFKKFFTNNPFKINSLLLKFKNVDIQKSTIFYEYSLLAMDLLNEKAEELLLLKDENSKYIAKNLYEECNSIAMINMNIKDKERCDNIFVKINNGKDFKYKFHKLVIKCNKNLFLLSINYSKEIVHPLKNNDSNDSKSELKNLYMLSYKLNKSLEDFDNFDTMVKRKEKLKLWFSCNSDLLEVHSLKIKNKLNLEKLLKYLQMKIELTESLGFSYTKTDWFLGMINIKKEIEKKSLELSDNKRKILERIKEKFKNIFNSGNKEFIKYLLKNYPCSEVVYSNEKIEKYFKKRKLFFKILKSSYKNANKFLLELNEDEKHINDYFDEIKIIILEYLNEMIIRQYNE